MCLASGSLSILSLSSASFAFSLSLVFVSASLFLQGLVPGLLSLLLSFPRLPLGSCHSLKLLLSLCFSMFLFLL